MPTIRAKPASVFTFVSAVRAEQDGGRTTTTQDPFPDMSIQSLATLLKYSE